MVYLTAVLDGGFVLVLSASERQVKEFHLRFTEIYRRFPYIKGEVLKTEASFDNGGRIVTVPCEAKTVRVYHGVQLLVIDEAAQVPDDVFGAIRPSLAISKGRTMALSTPFGKRGFFYEMWEKPGRRKRAEISWQACPRISPEFVQEERDLHGDLWVAQEYECQFLDLTTGSPFDVGRWEHMTGEVEML